MKLGIAYSVFDGEELLEYAIKAIRSEVDFASVVYQTTSYFGNQAHDTLLPTLDGLRDKGYLDRLIHYEPDLSLTPKENELRIRNVGLQVSRDAGCTHHISSDVDECYKPDELAYAKKVMDSGGYDSSAVLNEIYYKEPTWLIYPNAGCMVSFIHPVTTEYDMKTRFVCPIEVTRRLKPCDNCRVFRGDELVIHHMSYVRNDIRKKLMNSMTGTLYKIDRFVADYDKYRLGDKIIIAPDFITRRTRLVENYFGIPVKE